MNTTNGETGSGGFSITQESEGPGNVGLALGVGALAAVVGAVGWGLITKYTGYEVGYVAVGGER